MNYQHIDALLRWSHSAKHADLNGRKLVTQGYFACEYESFNGESEHYPKLSESWEKWAKRGANPAKVGDCFAVGEFFYRSIGNAFVNEAYLRCFLAEGVTFTTTAKDKEVLIHSASGEFVGALMPVRYEAKGETIPDPTDAQVFAHFSSEENGFYLASDKELCKQLIEWEAELDEKEDELYSLQSHIETLERNIKSGREKLKRLVAFASTGAA